MYWSFLGKSNGCERSFVDTLKKDNLKFRDTSLFFEGNDKYKIDGDGIFIGELVVEEYYKNGLLKISVDSLSLETAKFNLMHGTEIKVMDSIRVYLLESVWKK